MCRILNTTRPSDAQAEFSIMGHISDLVSIIDDRYTYRAVSHGYELFFGIKAKEIVGKTILELHGEQIFTDIIKPVVDLALNGTETHLEFCRENAKGELRYLDGKHALYSGPLIKGKGVAVIARDVTDIVLARQAIEKERALLSNIINAIPELIFAKNQHGEYTECNRSFEEFLGKQRDEILGKTDDQLMSEKSATHIKTIDKQVIESGEPLRFDEWVVYQDGRKRLLEMNKIPLVSETDIAHGILGIGRNVTFERRTEHSQMLASMFFEVTSNACFIVEANGSICSHNAAAQAQFGLHQPKELMISDLMFCSEGDLTHLDTLLGKEQNWSGEAFSHDGEPFIASIHKVPGHAELIDRYVIIIQDPSQQTQTTTDLLIKAYQDPLTQLPNRRLFFSKLESAIVRAERRMAKLAVLYIDLNNFKPINDELGHGVGDQVLKTIGARLDKCFRKNDTFARIGGDEFAALVDINDKAEAQLIADKIEKALKDEIDLAIKGHKTISASIGISYFPDDAINASMLLQKADQAMYAEKEKAKPLNN